MINRKANIVTPGKWIPTKEEVAHQEKNASILKSESFIQLCENAGIKPTKRQAVKYKNKRGLAYACK